MVLESLQPLAGGVGVFTAAQAQFGLLSGELGPGEAALGAGAQFLQQRQPGFLAQRQPLQGFQGEEGARRSG